LHAQASSDDETVLPGLDALFDLLQLAIKERTQLAL